MTTRYILKGANALVAENYAADRSWLPDEWFYVGGSHDDELVIIDLEKNNG
ncbi:hypothetical protein UFOVP111_129 [uncultured Caudovirales phage]|uniref:Uncharacterized protein n=1 Tax=uncultured Caudovirales phage TaxID=2100421 RepID=A0A6J5L6T7_9CAUD|nr:hypothetical protein UFOVP111_129 [uncultured Caudovirales phage]